MPYVKAVGAQTHTTGGDATVVWPTHAAGDIALLFVETGDGGSDPVLGTAAGFVAVTGSPVDENTSPSTKLAVFWCRATSNSMASPVVTGPGNHCLANIITFGDCLAAGDPTNVVATGVQTPGASTLSIPGATTTLDKCLVVAAATTSVDGGSLAWASAQANSDLSDVHEVLDIRTDDGGGGGIQVAVGTMSVAGAYGATTVTTSSTTSAMMSVALAPYIPPTLSVGLSAGIATATAHASNAPGQPSPTISSPSPTPGDFTADRESARLTKILFRHTKGSSTSAAVPTVYAILGSDVYLVYGPNAQGADITGFSPMFADRSTVVDNGDGTFDFSLLPGGGWWGNPVLTSGDYYEATVV